jgi:hypothetical protein
MAANRRKKKKEKRRRAVEVRGMDDDFQEVF